MEFRTVNAEYLIAMKIDAAIEYLYGNPEDTIKDEIYDKVKKYVQWSIPELSKEYIELTKIENQTKHVLVSVNEKYPGVVTEDSIDSEMISFACKDEIMSGV